MMKLNHAASLAAILVASSAGPALAADEAPGEGAQPAVLPNVRDTAAGTALQLRVDYVHLDGLDATLLAFQPEAQHITALGLGGYVTLPFVAGFGNGNSDSAVGNLELGGLYVIRGAGAPDVYLRGGLALDTASDDGVFAAPGVNVIPRLIDAPASGLGTSWLRGGGGLRGREGVFVYGGALNVDVPLEGNGGSDAFLGLAASLGAAPPGFGVSAGIALLRPFGGDGTSNDTLVGANIVGDVPVGRSARLFGVLGVSFEDSVDGFSFGVGVRAGL